MKMLRKLDPSSEGEVERMISRPLKGDSVVEGG